ncbi:1322_t:CDS:1 [Funneliformis geosporum]|uniref:1322_t:CDS:1 n=1 Tax=Funneliformis geosporum TaxID=1117311 RepID=A0A9W4S9K4_9GLOM|nr:1322_t:CDS:1 [Funneliformis geosporum]
MKKIANLTHKQERILLKIAKTGKGEAKKKAIWLLIYHNQKIVKYIAKGYSSLRGKVEYDDLIDEGISSLPKAIEKFDMNVKYRFSTYAIYWVKQFFQTFINQSQLIKQGPNIKEKKNLVFYDSNYQDNDNDSQSYSLADTLNDKENSELDVRQIHQKDIVIQINNAINSLANREEILLVRAWHKIAPTNLLDIYYLATEEEKEELKKKLKLSEKFNPDLLQKHSLEEKKNSDLTMAKKYLEMFAKKYKSSELVDLLNKSENAIRRLKKESSKKLQKIAQERNLHFLVGQNI